LVLLSSLKFIKLSNVILHRTDNQRKYWTSFSFLKFVHFMFASHF